MATPTGDSVVSLHMQAGGKSFTIGCSAVPIGMAIPSEAQPVIIGGRRYVLKGDPEALKVAYTILRSLPDEALSSLDSLQSALLRSKEIRRDDSSIGAKTSTVGTAVLASPSSSPPTEEALLTALTKCDPSDETTIKEIIKRSRKKPEALFALASQIEASGKLELANKIRDLARPFDLSASIERFSKQITEFYIDKEVAARCVGGLATKLRSGAYQKIYDIKEFADAVTRDLKEISHDGHLFIVGPKEMHPEISRDEAIQLHLKKLQSANFGFAELHTPEEGVARLVIDEMTNPKISFNTIQLQVKAGDKEYSVELTPQTDKLAPFSHTIGGVGYSLKGAPEQLEFIDKLLKSLPLEGLSSFDALKASLGSSARMRETDTLVFPCREKAASVMDQIRDSHPQAVIIDLRNNGGGSSYMSEMLCSYFKEEGVPLTSFVYTDKPQGEETLTFPTEPCVTFGYDSLPKEKRMLNEPVYILTSPQTFSAAEDLTHHMKGRATIIGETTGGGANTNRLYDSGEHFDISIPIGTAVVPGGGNWEGRGVTPDVPIDEELAHIKAERLILERA